MKTTALVVLLSLVQGLTEFLPVSSSGHLVLIRSFFSGARLDESYDVLVHTGTMLATVVFFRKEIVSIARGAVKEVFSHLGKPPKTLLALPNVKYVLFVAIAIIPAGLAGLFFKDFFETATDGNFYLLAIFFLITSTLLYGAHFFGNKERPLSRLSYAFPLIVGMTQIISLFTGISRSGSTIAAGLLAGAEQKFAVSFSFIMSIPLIAGASLVELSHLHTLQWSHLLAVVVSFLSGLFFLRLTFAFVQSKRLYVFAIYTQLIALVTLVQALRLS